MNLKFAITVFAILIFFFSINLISASSPVHCTKMLEFGYATINNPQKTFTAGEGACFIEDTKIVKIANIDVQRKTATIELYDKYSLVKRSTLDQNINSLVEVSGFQVKLLSVGGSTYWWIRNKWARVDIKWPSQDISVPYSVCERTFTMASTRTQQTFNNIGVGQCIKYGNYLIKKVGEFYSSDATNGGEGLYLDLFKKENNVYRYKTSLWIRDLKDSRGTRPPATKILSFEGLTIEPQIIYGRSVIFKLKVSFDAEDRATPDVGTETEGHPFEACRYDYNGDGIVSKDIGKDDRSVVTRSGKYNQRYNSYEYCTLGTKRVKCSTFDSNKDGKIDITDINAITPYLGKECPLSLLDYDKDGTIESINVQSGSDGYVWNQRYWQGYPDTSARICAETDNECLKFDLDGNYKVELEDYYFLGRYEGKTVEVPSPQLVTISLGTCGDNTCRKRTVTLQIGQQAIINYNGLRKTLELNAVESDGAIKVNDRKIITPGNTLTVNGLRVKNHARIYTTATGAVSQATLIVGEDYGICPADCREITEEEVPEAPTKTCTDSDGGTIIQVKGTMSGTTSKGESFTYPDWCYDVNTLKEFYCDSSKTPKHTFMPCTYGCLDGKCLSAPTQTTPPTCTDTDTNIVGHPRNDPNQYYEQGSVTNLGRTDYCSDDWLREQYCLERGTSSGVWYKCPNGCSNGACVTTTTTQACYDSDATKTFTERLATQGTCTDKNGEYMDARTSVTSVREYYCGPQYISGKLATKEQQTCLSTVYNCESYGFTSSQNGKCITTPTPTPTPVTETKPNLEFTRVSFKNPTVTRGQEAFIYADVKNTGAGTSENVFVGISIPKSCVLTRVDNSVFNGLQANRGSRTTFRVKCYTFGIKSINVYIDGGYSADGIIDESNENNNVWDGKLTVATTAVGTLGTGSVVRTTGFASKETFIEWLRSLFR